MNNFIRYYNQNRKKIWGIVIIIASAILLLQMANYFAKKSNEEKIANASNNIVEETYNTNTSTLTSNKSAVSGENVSGNQLENATKAIDKFISYCNNKDLQSAYDMLTDECKLQMYDTLEVFEQAYYNNNFNGQNKTCTIENWAGNTYKVRIIDDMLSTGKRNNGYAKQDYITVKKIDDTYKLNINNYIGYYKINKTTEKNNIKVEVVSKNTYMDYDEYTVKVTNNTENTIMLDTKTDVKSLYIEDKSGGKHSSYNHELTDPMLIIQAGQTKEVTIKFYSSFVSTKQIKYVVFSDLILNYDEYSQTTNKNIYTNKMEFKASV